MTTTPAPFRARLWTRLAADVGLWAAIGIVMALLGPFGSSERSLFERVVYWQLCMVGGGAIGIAIDTPVRRLLPGFWPRLLASSALMTPPVTMLVALANNILAGMRLTPRHIAEPWFQVFVVCFAAMCLRQLVWAEAPAGAMAAPEEPPADPLAAFRQRLSAKRREATLIAVEAEDHYLRVHTDAGDELITARFGDAVTELAGAKGFQTHRSWWIAADAIEDVKWLRGRGEATLKCGLKAPISRGNAAALKAAGWF
ncbi:MAG: LytTR family transcriptional regulator [Phenylobacterium sp.]|uniref:LytTR family DNA-binding domain-containing protein n=1 Tax=Phenylobacterium sp. TaxID=1871053 RepID=UPI001A4F3520|nr:LytTR family DNA-binding domain-containing protein [Phenylobacterium sp.]MBL8556777.1 LytTR family transcriptional regulator [Phenylobacterium sp.]